MSEQNKSDEKSPQVTSGLTIIAVMLGLFFLQDTILNPTRPGMINADQWFSENIRARLWQDPFEVVNEHIGKNKKPYQDIAEQLKNIAEQHSERKTAEEVSPEFKKHPFPATPEKAIENAQHPMRVCYRGGLYENGEEAAHSIQELGCQIANANTAVSNEDNKSGEVKILAVMVPGGPYAEDREMRLRSRYATISALLAWGYVPEDADHIGFIHFAKFCKKTINKTGQTQKETPDICNLPAVMPYEWFSANMNNPETTKHAEYRPGRVLVLWLDNDAFYRADKPLYMIDLLNSLITTAYEKTSKIDRSSSSQSDVPLPEINFQVIGPSNSDTLEKIYQEVSRLKTDIRNKNHYKYLRNSYLYTASATVPNQHLSGNPDAINRTAGYLKRLILKNNMDWLKKTIVRTISTQDRVAHTLLCELALRGVTPYRFKDKDKENDIKDKCKLTDLKFDESGQPSQIALIGEADTYYAWMLRHSILEQIQKFDDPADKTENNNVSFFSYLRGIDGITSQNTLPNQEKGKNQEHKTNNPNEKEAKTLLERPIGNNQLDYLLGLGANLKQLEQRNIAEDKGAFKAIGIIGSDVHDKLLILQALRNKFPGVPFFTTDLDARFLHSSEIKWTRNLIVVSPFGLQLKLNTERSNSPPFRDNFQTSLYISISLAMTCSQGYWQCEKSVHEPPNGENGWTHYPRVFEVGNYEAVNISHTPNSTYVDNQSEKPNQNSFPKLIFLILLLSPICIFFTPKQFHFPIGIFTGTLIILYTTITIAFDYYGILDFLNKLMPDYFEKPVNSKEASFSSLFVEPFSFTNGVSSWPLLTIRLLTILLASFLLYRVYKLIKINQEEIREEFLPSQTAEVYKNHSENKMAEKEPWKLQLSILSIDNWKIDDSAFEAIWRNYREKAKLGFSIVRILFIFFLFISFITLIQMFGDKENLIAPAPFRGEFNFDWIRRIAFAVIVAYLALILYIADHVHLSSHFIKLLANQPAIIWPVELTKIYKNKYGLPENIVQYKILLDFIHRHTAIHNKFIFYPFICLFLIIMSRNHYFDNWLITPFMVLIYLFFALVTLMSALRLRAAAMYAKKEIFKRLNTNSAQSPIYEWRYRKNDNIVKLKSLTFEIENFKEGIFKPLLHHPMILSLLMPFSSVGGVYLIEYLL